MPISNFFNQVTRKAGQVWGQADRAVGGWLPGGGVASPLTKAVFPPQPFPGRSKELEQLTGIRGRFIDPAKTQSLVSRFASIVSPRWGTSDYANPLLNEVGMSSYSGGRTERDRRTEIHELGHLNPKDKGPYSYFGVLGRSLQGLSDQTGNSPLTDLAAGLALQYADAPEEDRAERFTRQFAHKQKYHAPAIGEDGTSGYGNSLREEGKELTSGAIYRLADPYGLVYGTAQFIRDQRAKPIRAELTKNEAELKRLWNSAENYEVTPEQIKVGRRVSELRDQLDALNQ